MRVEKLLPDGLPIVVEGVPPVVVATGRRTFYFTGQIASDSNGDLVGDTIEEQAVQVSRIREAVAAAVGVTFADLNGLADRSGAAVRRASRRSLGVVQCACRGAAPIRAVHGLATHRAPTRRAS